VIEPNNFFEQFGSNAYKRMPLAYLMCGWDASSMLLDLVAPQLCEIVMSPFLNLYFDKVTGNDSKLATQFNTHFFKRTRYQNG